MLSGGQAAQFAAEHSRVHDVANAEQQRLEHGYPPPPKKPLTPYMRFNKLVSFCKFLSVKKLPVKYLIVLDFLMLVFSSTVFMCMIFKYVMFYCKISYAL